MCKSAMRVICTPSGAVAPLSRSCWFGWRPASLCTGWVCGLRTGTVHALVETTPRYTWVFTSNG